MLCGQEITYKEPQLKATLLFVTSASHGKSHLLASYSDYGISTGLQRGGICRDIFFTPHFECSRSCFTCNVTVIRPKPLQCGGSSCSRRAMPCRSFEGPSTNFATSKPYERHRKLALKADEIDWENICNVADLFLDINFLQITVMWGGTQDFLWDLAVAQEL